eukprot:gene35022-42412_t
MCKRATSGEERAAEETSFFRKTDFLPSQHFPTCQSLSSLPYLCSSSLFTIGSVQIMKHFIAAVVKRRNYPIKLVRMSQSADSGSSVVLSNKLPETIVDPSTEKGHKIENASTPPDHWKDVMDKASKDAKWIAEAETKEIGTSRVLMILSLRIETERELAFERISKERELGQQKLKLVVERMENECQGKMIAQASYHASEMAVIQQRSVLEQFFTECVGKYNEIVEAQKVASGAKRVSALEETAKKHLKTVFTLRKMPNFRQNKGLVTMTSVNQLLLCEAVRKDVFQALKLDNLPFPGVPEGLLFGSLSFSIHHPAFKTVFLSKDTDEDMKQLWMGIAHRLKKATAEYDPVSACMGKEHFLSSSLQMGHVVRPELLGTGGKTTHAAGELESSRQKESMCKQQVAKNARQKKRLFRKTDFLPSHQHNKNSMIFFGLLSLLAVVAAALQYEDDVEYSVRCAGSQSGCELVKGRLTEPSSHAYGTYSDEVNKDGWGKIWVHADATDDGWYQAGYLEGALTAQRIYQHFTSWYAYQFPTPPANATLQFLYDQMDYAKNLAQSKRKEDVYYDTLAKLLAQFQGILDGQNAAAADGEKLSFTDLLLLEAAGDLYEIIPATVPSAFKLRVGAVPKD